MFKKIGKLIVGISVAAVVGMGLAACSDNGNGSGSGGSNPPATETGTGSGSGSGSGTASGSNTDTDTGITGEIAVITREDGSGTRVAFVEIADVTINGNDNITLEAVVAPGTSVMMVNVADNPLAIGYASTGVALADDRVNVLSINGVAPTVENMLNGTYPIQRPFLIAFNTQEGLSPLAQDFVDFILSAQGQEIVANRGYVPVVPTDAPEYTPSGLTGSIVVNGSSSLYSLMGHLREAFEALNPDTRIDVHGAGTGHGISAVRDGLADIALSSRDLRDTELEFLTPMSIAIDGIAVIVHPSNSIESLTLEQVREIFLGSVTEWETVR